MDEGCAVMCRTMRLWSPVLGANLAAYRGHLFPVWDVAACPGGLYAATASADRTARVWSTERTQSLRILAGGWTSKDTEVPVFCAAHCSFAHGLVAGCQVMHCACVLFLLAADRYAAGSSLQ